MRMIECQNLSYQAGKYCLLKNLNAQFHAGNINVILGQNGAGKSTLLQLLAKSLSPSQGKILWQKEDLNLLSLPSLAMQRAVIEQQQTMQFDFTVRQLVSLGLEVQFGSEILQAYSDNPEFSQLLEQVLATCDLQNLAERSVLSLSGGEFKRVHIARAIAQIWPRGVQNREVTERFNGRWLLMDEWNAALDIGHQQRLAELLRQWRNQGLGIIMVVHDPILAAQLADRVLLIQNGKAFAEGLAEEVLTSEILEQGLQIKLQTCISEDGKKNLIPVF